METLQRTANRGSISTGYDIDNSLKLDGDENERMQRASSAIGTPTNAKIATLSFWAKRSELISNNAHFSFIANAGADSSFICFEQDKARVYTTGGNSLMSNALFRDTSAWYHFVAAFDMTQGTAANRVKIYINGVQITSFQTETYGTQNNDIGLYDLNMSHYIGYAGSQGWFGYITELNLIDGQQLAPTEFGETDEDSGIWKPKAYDGTYGDEGYYLDMSNSSNLGEDQSGNDNDFGSLYNVSSADQATDTPTNNFATTNYLYKYGTETFTTEGATVVTKNANGWVSPQSTICPASGKWYMEFKFNAADSRIVGAAPIGGTLWNSATHYGGTVGSNSVGYADTGYLYVNDSGVSSNYGPSYDNSNIIAVALDMDNGYIYWAKDNTWINSANPAGGSGGYALPAGLVEHSIGASIYQQAKQSFANFGGYTTISISSAESDANGYGTFEYAPPSGYLALCTKNLGSDGG
jgi:hypothetical protein